MPCVRCPSAPTTCRLWVVANICVTDRDIHCAIWQNTPPVANSNIKKGFLGAFLWVKENPNLLKVRVLTRFGIFSSGERGIRTPGTSQCAGFQDRCNRPLYHLSRHPCGRIPLKIGCKDNMFFLFLQIFERFFSPLRLRREGTLVRKNSNNFGFLLT